MLEEDTLASMKGALEFINKYGAVTLFPIRKLTAFPSLYRATKGNRQQKFDNAWGWADKLAENKQIHYGKLIRKQVTLVSLEMFPYFYKVYNKIPLSEDAKKIREYIKKRGSTSTSDLRKNLGFAGKENKQRFANAIDQLQTAFFIAIVGREKPPKMTHIYDLIERWMPKQLVENAQKTETKTAKEKIVEKLLENKIITNPSDAKIFLGKLFF
jgi:YesN/AraC family two-component response regulator